jgi:4-hydroxybenzoate polyprenyltransferase
MLATLWHLLQAMRPRQWTKNLLLFASFLFSVNQIWRPFAPSMWEALFRAGAAFLAFTSLSAGVYLFNDLNDIEQDRRHPTKRLRPLASGALPVPLALVAAVVLVAAGLGGSLMLRPLFFVVTLSYLLMQVAYTLWWKHVVILDVFVLAMGFVMRAVSGALVLRVFISPWLYIVTFLGALFLGLCKRRHELLLLEHDAGAHRRILAEYSPQLLDQMISIATASTIMAYSLYTFTSENLPKNHMMMLTIPHVLYGLFRYLYLAYRRDQGGSPEEALLRDRPLRLAIVLWVATATAILWLGRAPQAGEHTGYHLSPIKGSSQARA